MQIDRIYIYLLLTLLLIGCNRNDYSPNYQKELLYDGTQVPIDTMMIDIYSVQWIEEKPVRDIMYSSITKWYDINGYNSMTKSIVYLKNGERTTLEQISRDKNSLPIARNISIESPNAETMVTLARLKRRNEGKEEWLIRHYLDPKRYLEETSLQFYTKATRITKKKSAESDSLLILGIDTFSEKGYLLSKEPTNHSKERDFSKNYYNEKGLLDSIVSKTFEGNNPSNRLLTKRTESYKYELDSDGNVSTMHTYFNDSLLYISDYRYAYRR